MIQKQLDPDMASSSNCTVFQCTGNHAFRQYMHCPLAESEYIGLLNAARYVLGTIYLMEEMIKTFCQVETVPVLKCKMFEDNNSALEIANVPKMQPQTRHINVQYHHFRSHSFCRQKLIGSPNNSIHNVQYTTTWFWVDTFGLTSRIISIR